jgi:drug/metabolite transporter (DMT)-like permease
MQRLLHSSLPHLVLQGCLMGIGFVVARYALRMFGPLTLRSVHMGISVVLLIAVYAFLRRRLPQDWALWGQALLVGLAGTALPIISMVMMLKYLSSGVATLFLSLNPVVVMFLAWLFLSGEPLTARKLAGAAVAFGGASLILLRGESGLGVLSRADPRGYAWSASAVLSLAGFFVYARRYLTKFNMMDITLARLLVAVVVFFALGWQIEGLDVSAASFGGWMAILYLGVMVSFVAYQYEFYIIRRFGASTNAQINYITPIVATLGGVLALGEQFTPTIAAGMAAVLVGLWLING